MYKFGGQTFSSQKKTEDHIRTVLSECGCTESLRSANPTAFESFFRLFQTHPDRERKFKDVISDVMIRRHPRNKKAYELWIKYPDGSVDSISWRCCVSGKIASMHEMQQRAFRRAVDAQIEDFRSTHYAEACEICQTHAEEMHVDHVIQFIQLTADFMEESKLPVPTEFIKNMYYQHFTERDAAFEQAWSAYHKQTAVLRMLCKKCNLSRNRLRGVSISRL